MLVPYNIWYLQYRKIPVQVQNYYKLYIMFTYISLENEKVVFSVKLTDPTQVYQMSSNNILFRSNGTDAVVKVGNHQGMDDS